MSPIIIQFAYQIGTKLSPNIERLIIYRVLSPVGSSWLLAQPLLVRKRTSPFSSWVSLFLNILYNWITNVLAHWKRRYEVTRNALELIVYYTIL